MQNEETQNEETGPLFPPSRRAFLMMAALGWAGSGAFAQGKPLPPAPHTPAQRELRHWFEVYLAAFNRSDFPVFGTFYAKEVQFHGQATTLTGRDAVLDFYRNAHRYLAERVELITFVGAPEGDHILAALRTTLTANRDWPDMPTGPMAKGARRESVNFVMYDIADRHFTRIRSARFSPQKGARS
ncbi:MAG: nuclear transport factor 2 family protein [Sphingomonadales bacterium]|nr:MAG: nuclear transport factor 2 family protein [Sphingomonadales bacterium]TNF03274.1 MAG: nuclear transport factor 2 family protein [Sphingomonadales bacterium]